MAGEDQYIHPVIQAIISSVQARQNQQQLAATIAQRQQENQLAQQRLQQQQQQIENEHEYQKGLIENNANLYKAHLGNARLQALKDVTEAGGQPTSLATPGAPPNTLDLGPIGSLDLSNFPTLTQRQQTLGDIEAQQAGKKVGAVRAAAQPFDFALEELKNGHQIAMQKAAQDFTTRLETDIKQPFEEQQNKLNRQSQMALEGVRAGIEKYRVDKEYGVTPQQMTAGLHGLMTAQIQPNMTNPIDRNMTTTALGMGVRLPNKQDAAAFESLGGMQDVYKKLDAVIDQLPSEKNLGTLGATANALGLSSVAHSALSTDLKNSLNELAPQAYQILKNVQGYTGNRMNTNEMNYIQNGLLNIGTKEQAQDYKRKLQESVDNRITSGLEAGMPTFQQNALYTTWGTTPAWIVQARQDAKAQNLEKQGFKVDIGKSVEKGQLVYTPPGQ